MPAPVVFRSWPCPSCEAEEGFRTKVRLGDYVETIPHKHAKCSECGYLLTEDEEEAILEQAWESAPEDYRWEAAEYNARRLKR